VTVQTRLCSEAGGIAQTGVVSPRLLHSSDSSLLHARAEIEKFSSTVTASFAYSSASWSPTRTAVSGTTKPPTIFKALMLLEFEKGSGEMHFADQIIRLTKSWPNTARRAAFVHGFRFILAG